MYGEGNVIQGRYRLEQQLGEGGMATVWRAMHLALQRPVAIKFLHPSSRHAQEMAKRFLREARVAAAVHHRNVVDILDFGIAENDDPYMVMELLRGETLADRMTREPGLEASEVASVFDQLLRGLGAVHDAGIVHRDLKPENVFILEDDEEIVVKLLDFGVSRAAAETGLESVYHTRDSLVVGTPHYMSPEQARGVRELDARTDLYAVGAMLFEVLAGRPPFEAELPGDLIVKITTEPPPPLSTYRPDLPDALCEVVARSLARDPDARFGGATAMRRALREVLTPHARMPRSSVPELDPDADAVLARASRPTMPTDPGAQRASRPSLRPVDVRAARPSDAPSAGRRRGLTLSAAALVLATAAGGTGWLLTGDGASGGQGEPAASYASQPAATGSGSETAEPGADEEPEVPRQAAAASEATGEAAARANEAPTAHPADARADAGVTEEPASERRSARRAGRRERRSASSPEASAPIDTPQAEAGDPDATEASATRKIVRDPGF